MSTASPMREAKPPRKPANQGTAGKVNVSPALHGANTNPKPGMGGLVTNSIKAPGSGTKGGGQTHNSPART